MKRNTIIRLVKVGIAFAMLAIIVRKFNISSESLKACRDHSEYILLACLIPLTIVPAVSINRWKLFLSEMGIKERFLPLWKINLISTFQGLILPSTQGVDAFRMYHIAKRHPNGTAGAAGSVLVERMIGMLVWCGIALVGLPFVLPYVTTRWTIGMFVIGFGVASMMGSLLIVNPRIHKFYTGYRPKIKVLARVIEFLDKTHETLVTFPYRKVLVSSIGLIVIYQFCSITCVCLLFKAYGCNLPIWQHMAFYPVIAIIAMMPVTIGGFGVREGAFAYFYSLAGAPVEVAVCVSVMNYVILSLLPASLGALISFYGAIQELFNRRY